MIGALGYAGGQDVFRFVLFFILGGLKSTFHSLAFAGAKERLQSGEKYCWP